MAYQIKIELVSNSIYVVENNNKTNLLVEGKAKMLLIDMKMYSSKLYVKDRGRRLSFWPLGEINK